jgi:hypothetical protein
MSALKSVQSFSDKIIPTLRHKSHDGAARHLCTASIGEIGEHAEVSPHGP